MRARETYLALYRGRLTISNVNLRENFVSTTATYSSSKIKQTLNKIKNKKLQNELNFNQNQN